MPVVECYDHGVPNWVDLATTDSDAAQAFFAGLFGWEFEERPTDQGPYMIGLLGGHRVAGLMQMPPDILSTGAPSMWSTYVAVDDIDATVANVAGAGGEAIAVNPADPD